MIARLLVITGSVLLPFAAGAIGLATCDSGKDGGCYEVYALNEKGERVEAYFHPRTLSPMPAGAKGHKG